MPEFSLIHHTHPAREGAAPHPGLVLLHGLGSNELDLLGLANDVTAQLYVISARAPFPYRWGGHMWFDLENHGFELGTESIEHSLERLDAFLSEIVDYYPIDAQRIILGGFSMGAAMAGAYSLLHPNRVVGTIMASGFLPPDNSNRYQLQEASGLPLFQAHGTADPVVPLKGARMTRDFLQHAPVDLTYREYPMGHQVNSEEMHDLSTWLDRVLERASVQS